MTTAAGLPLPRLSRGRFVYSFVDEHGIGPENGGALSASTASDADAACSQCKKTEQGGSITAFTDEELFHACGVRIAFTERSGGTSVAPYDSLNLKHGLGDNCAPVAFNRAALMSAFNVDYFRVPLVNPNQVHGTDIIEIMDRRDIAQTAWAKGESAACGTDSVEFLRPGVENEQPLENSRTGSDAVVIGLEDVAALLCFADCLPLVLVAPTGTFSVVHCGWKGTVGHLAAKAARRLSEVSACEPAHFNAYIGAYIHPECFEVDEDVAFRFAAEFSPSVAIADAASGRWHVDLGASVVQDLMKCGLTPERIVDVGKCTVCDTDHFFSYRASGGTCGRHGAFAVRLNEGEKHIEHN